MIMTAHSSMHRQQGVSLIEALVALLVMAFGMLAVVGMQSSLRGNGDLARQRAEAVDIAQNAMEDWRSVTAIEAVTDVRDYSDLVSDGPTNITGANATYTLTRVVTAIGPDTAAMTIGAAGTPVPMPNAKAVSLSVTWTDRSGEAQEVLLPSIIAAIAPNLVGTLLTTVPSNGIGGPTVARPASIPVEAERLTDGTSTFKPTLPSGAPATFSWVFNNATGLLKVCTDAETAAVCAAKSFDKQLVSGTVQFAATGVAPDGAQAELPTGPSLNLSMVVTSDTNTGDCYDDASADAALAAARHSVTYYCAVSLVSPATTWSGQLRVHPEPFTVGAPWVIAATGAGNYKVCRYTTAANDTPARNSDHPLVYTNAGGLANQNFLVISAEHSCPIDVRGIAYFNASTRLHQSGVAPYLNP